MRSASAANAAGSSLMATSRLSLVSVARHFAHTALTELREDLVVGDRLLWAHLAISGM